jgi:hypothetical protein
MVNRICVDDDVATVFLFTELSLIPKPNAQVAQCPQQVDGMTPIITTVSVG